MELIGGDQPKFGEDVSYGVSYQWFVCDANGDNCEPVEGATGASPPFAVPEGRTIRCQVTSLGEGRGGFEVFRDPSEGKGGKLG